MRGTQSKCVSALLVAFVAMPISACTREKETAGASRQAKIAPAVPEIKVTNGPSVQPLSETSVRITWSTNVSANTRLRYGTSPDMLDALAEEPWGGLTHRVVLNNLIPGTTYYYRVAVATSQETMPTLNAGTFQTQLANRAR